MVFSMVLLVVSIYYIMTTTRHKEKMAMIEKGLEPSLIKDERFFLDAMKFGLAAIGAGLGFFAGMILETSKIFHSDIELPLYYAPIFIFIGIGLIIFYKVFGKRYRS